MMIDYNQQVSIPSHVIYRELQGESVLLNLDSERYFGLDQIGTRIWEVLAESETILMAYQTLLEEYDVEPEIIKQDIDKLNQNLLDQGLVVVANDSKRR